MTTTKAVKTCRALNVDEDESTISPQQLLITSDSLSDNSYIVTDVDEELIILIEFNQMIDLKSIKVFALSNAPEDCSPPKQVHIYNLNNLNVDFDDIKSMKPDKSIKCYTKKLAKGQFINLRKNSRNSVKFKKTKYLAIYINSNQNDSEKTYLNGINLNGDMDQTEPLLIDIKDGELLEPGYAVHFDLKNNSAATVTFADDIKKNEYETVNDDLLDCLQLQRLKSALTEYYEKTASNDGVNIDTVLDDYVYLRTMFCDNDYNFQYIYNHLEFNCNINHCKIVRRRDNRNRTEKGNTINISSAHDDEKESEKNESIQESVIEEIMNKIHCYFCHSYDIANRLTIKDRLKINNVTCNIDKIQKLQNILYNKKKLVEDEALLNEKRCFKFNQLFKDQKKEQSKIYSFGKRFRYIYNGVERKIMNGYFNQATGTSICVKPKYGTFKAELTTNDLSTLTIKQFNTEYLKAMTHFNSYFCKKKYRPFFEAIDGDEVGHIELYHLLAMLIYCNYDTLQFIFSKTYRENITDHGEFYHLGKYLQICDNAFGEYYC
eukprot:255517_1